MEEQDQKDIIAQYMEKDAELLQENGVHPQNVGEVGSIKNQYWKFVGAFLVIIMVGLVIIPFIGDYIDKQRAQTKDEQFAAGQEYIHNVQEQLKNDKDGGTTPEETLKMFIAALKENNIEKAKLYYSPYPENRSAMFKDRLDQLNKEGKIGEVITLLSKATPEKSEAEEGYASYSYINTDGKLAIVIRFDKATQFSTIWKIESLAY
jgi:hypothetical protein